MIENRDGTFGEPEPLPEALDRFRELCETAPELVRALHVGTERELRSVRERRSLEERVREIEGRLDTLSRRGDQAVDLSILDLPTREEVERFGGADE